MSEDGVDWKGKRFLRRLGDALKLRVVTKFCRAQLLLPAFRSWFNPILIHLRRDPRAIIPSFRRAFDDQWWNSLALEDQFLSVQDGRREFFQPWTDEIRRLDRKGMVDRLTAYWALTEKHVQEHKSDSGHISLSYEQLCLEGQSYLADKLSDQFQNASPQWRLKKNSITTNTVRLETESAKRIDSWKEESDPTTIRTVERVIDDLGMADLLPSY